MKNSNNNKFQCYAILLAAGKGSRLESQARIKKQFINYKDAPLWWQSVKTFYASPHITGIVIVFPSDDEEFFLACEEATKLHAKENLGIPFIYAKGGEKRHNSVFSGLQALPSSCSHVLVHDSARPFFSAHLVHKLIAPFISLQDTSSQNKLSQNKLLQDKLSQDKSLPFTSSQDKSLQDDKIYAVIPAIAVTDTIKIIKNTNNPQDGNILQEQVETTLERSFLRAIQTPQAFSVDALMEAHKQIVQTRELTDDAMLMENAGHTVYVIQGEADNIKITHAEDLKLLQNPIQQIPCSGFGYDVHRFGGNRPFILGGISIPTPLQIEAHSDGDVLLHALMDALLSCMCLGDIGTHFPDSNPKYNNISSSFLLDHVMDLWKESALTLCHVDLTIITQKPKISPFAKEISKNVARLLSISPSFVNTKATTEEKLGFTGEGRGIKAIALVSALKTIEN